MSQQTIENNELPATTRQKLNNNFTEIYTNQGNSDSAIILRELLANKATDFTVLNNVKYPTTQAVKTFVDSAVAGLLDLRGAYDASTNLFPATGGSGTAGAILKGDTRYISVAGTLGGMAVVAGDVIFAVVDAPGQTVGNRAKLETNIGYVALSNILATGQIFVGSVGGIATAVALTGDATISSLGVITLGTVAVLKGGTGATTASGARSNLGLIIGTDIAGFVGPTRESFYDTFATGVAGDLKDWATFNAGGGSSAVATTTNSDANHYGVMQFNVGTTATGRAGITRGLNTITVAGANMEINCNLYINDLATVAQDYIAYIGLGDIIASGDMTDGVYFEYNRAISPNWILKTAQGATRTSSITTTVVVQAIRINMKIVINTAGTLATFFINGVNIGTVATNIPGVGQFTNPIYKFEKTVGTTGRLFFIDYYKLDRDIVR